MFYVCYSHDYFLFKISNPHLNIESSHWILELETTTQHGSWCLQTRIVNYKCALSDGKLPEALPGFLSSANPSFLGQPQESQRWTYPSLQNLQTAEKAHIGGDGQQKKTTLQWIIHRVVCIFWRTPEPSRVETNVEFPRLNLKHWLQSGIAPGNSFKSPDMHSRLW